MEENRRIPPPPRPIPPRPPTSQNTENNAASQNLQSKEMDIQVNNTTKQTSLNEKSKPKREPLSEQTKNALFYCGGAISFALAVVCLILVFIL